MIVWARPDQKKLVRDALRGGRLTLVAVGAETPAEGGLAHDLKVESAGPLRDALMRTDIDLWWLASGADFDGPSRQRLRGLRGTPTPVFCTEPLPSTVAQLRASDDAPLPVVPLFRHSPGWRAAAELLETFGDIDAAAVTMTAGVGEGSLLARIYDCFDLLSAIFGPPEMIDAAMPRGTGVVPGTLLGRQGHVTGHVRFGHGHAAAFVVTAGGGAWSRRMDLLGRSGRLVIDDCGFVLHDASGAVVEENQVHETLTAGQLVGMAVGERLRAAEAPVAPVDHAAALASCDATLLSCRTGQSEDPRRVREMLLHP